MTVIVLYTKINATIETAFDHARDLDLHLLSTAKTKERIVAGRNSGLIEKGETVTWKACHFGFWLTHESVISEMEIPFHFTDEMKKGRFKSFRHDHYFEQKHDHVLMTDKIVYETPFGIFGKLFDKIVLQRYLVRFISDRNLLLKNHSEKKSL